MQGKYCYGFYYDKQCCSRGQLPIGNNKEASLAQDVGVAPPPRALGELHIKAHTEMLCPKGVPYVKLSFTSIK